MERVVIAMMVVGERVGGLGMVFVGWEWSGGMCRVYVRCCER